MPQHNKSSHTDEQREAGPIEAGQEEMDAGTKTSQARIWAAANKLTLDGEDQFPENEG